jgi:hypothetical protein
MNCQAVLDTGPLVAAINRHDTHHQWTVDHLKQLPDFSFGKLFVRSEFLWQHIHIYGYLSK